MVYLIFSDVHSNLEALTTFARLAKAIPHDRMVCLGDIVGYAADPNPCVDWVRQNADLILAGNHDHAVAGTIDPARLVPHAHQACLWTREVLSAENMVFLRGLPVKKIQDDILWVHSTPREPAKWHYLTELEDAEDQFNAFTNDLCFYGHTHWPMIFECDLEGNIRVGQEGRWQLQTGYRYIVNVGSIGQPRDGNPAAAFAIYDSKAQYIEVQRFTYDFTVTQRKILEHRLPPSLAERLSLGR
jgi:diadenosine tetraphosphatase ApaH/serine/threonine PP2A family protein phosphatase